MVNWKPSPFSLIKIYVQFFYFGKKFFIELIVVLSEGIQTSVRRKRQVCEFQKQIIVPKYEKQYN